MSFTSQGSAVSNETFGKDASFKLSQLIGSMSISPSGRDVVLGSKEGLHIIDLDSPYSPPRFLPHRTPWEVADVQWSPFADRDYWVVSTSNQKALVWNLNMYGWRNSLEHVLHGHTRAITDINFSAHHPDKLATCAVDSFVHCWDLRCPARPVTSFSDWFAGATQVKWSRQEEHVIASSHDKFLHIWDKRKGAYPARTIEAHDTKIYGIDWNRFQPSKIVTCSLDKTIKFWDTNNSEDIPERTIETTFPVWRARHTPYGWGLMVMPQRGNGDLHLYDRRAVHSVLESGRVKPVHVFPGHKGQVKEFLWRAFGTVKEGVDHRDFQLVSWGTDHELRLHAVSEDIFASVGYEKGVSKPQRLRFTRRGAKYRTFRDEPTGQDAVLVGPPRADSFPASNEFLRVKGRSSTNMGMSRVPAAQFKGWLHAGKGVRRTDMHGKSSGRPDTDPISWMKNVKIASWDTDTLADEITQVGEKFKKVDFEAINVSQRQATMSLETPWGESGSTLVYTRLDFKFPKGYPKDAQAIVNVQRTNLITSETQKKLTADIHKIAEAHKLKGRGCVEAIVRYLLKEQTMEQIINWLMRDSLTDSKVIEAANDAQDASDDSDDDQIDPMPNAVHSNANINVPLAKCCAAVWAENGMLVCFFQLKDKGPASFLTSLGTGQLDESESSRLFGGFGKFQVDSPSRKVKDPAKPTQDDLESEHSDQSSVFSSSTSSPESSIEFEERNRFVPWQRTTLDSLQRGRSADGSLRSTTLDGTRGAEVAPKAVVSICDLSNLLSANQAAAKEYQIKNDIASTCEHNLAVATRHSLKNAETGWRLAGLILCSTPPKLLQDTLELNPDLLLAERIRMIISGEGVSERHGSTQIEVEVPSWPESLLGKTYLNHAVMEFFDKSADVQMLALLSAMFLMSQQMISRRLLVLGTGYSSRRGETPSEVANLSQAWPKARETHFGAREKSSSIHEPGARAGIPGEPMQEYAGASTSMHSFMVQPGLESSAQSPSAPPSVVAHDPSGFVSAMNSAVVSLAGSPENYRLYRRSESSAAFPVASASFYGLARSRPASPPNPAMHRDSARTTRSSKSLRPSPDENFIDSRSRLKTSLSLANVSGYGESSHKLRRGRDNARPILKTAGNEAPVRRPGKKKLKTTFHVSSNLLGGESGGNLSSQVALVGAYRQCLSYVQQYITLLEVWRLWTQRAEMANLCAQTVALIKHLTNERSLGPSQVEVQQGLEIRRCCPRCGSGLAPIEKNGIAIGWHCVSQGCQVQHPKPSKKQRCSICETVIHGLSIPCLQCGHLTCYECAQGWFGQHYVDDLERSNSTSQSEAQQNNEDYYSSCPTGCGCSCPSLSAVTVPYPETSLAGSEKDLAIATPQSEGYQDDSNRPLAITENRSHRQSVSNVVGGPERALNALLALQGQSRHRSTSSAHSASTLIAAPNAQPTQEVTAQRMRARENSISAIDELLPWATGKSVGLGKGVGGGLSRGLSNRGSDATMRKALRES